jgi:tetratricopeptide (TPR) repeat protein
VGRSKRTRWALGVAAAALSAAAHSQVIAPMDPALERQVDEAYRQVLQQPADLAAWSRYARLQVQGGNYEGGIAALERLMLQPGSPPELPLEIGVLYYRLGSYAMAEAMVRRALEDPGLSPAHRALAQQVLRDLAKRNQPSQLSGSFSFGVRSHTNPAYRTSESQVFSGGVLGPVAPDQRPDSDWDAHLGLRLHHLYDLDLQNSGAISSTLGVHVVDYHQSRGSSLTATPTRAYDLVFAEASTGFEFKPMPESAPGLTLRPHVALGGVLAQQHKYLDTRGVGLDVTYRFSERTVIDGTLDVHRRDFEQRIDLTNANDVSGRLSGVRARLTHEVAPGRVLTGELLLRKYRTDRAFYDYDQQEARFGYTVSYGSPMAALPGTWSTALWLAAQHRSYDAADPSVSAATTRRDEEWRVTLSQTIPVADQWFALVSIEHARNRSNLPNFRYRNTSAAASLLRTF